MFGFQDLSIDNFEKVQSMAEELSRKSMSSQKSGVKSTSKKSKSNKSTSKKSTKKPSSSSASVASKESSRESPDPKSGGGEDAGSVVSALSETDHSLQDFGESSHSINNSNTSSKAVGAGAARGGSKCNPPTYVSGRSTNNNNGVVGKNTRAKLSKKTEPAPVAAAAAATAEPAPPKAQQESAGRPVFAQSMIVFRTWEQIKFMDNYQEHFGEQIVLRMMEMDAQARSRMGITSLRSQKFSDICSFMVELVELLVSLVGMTDIDDFSEELVRMGKQCQENGIPVSLLPEAVSFAIGKMMEMAIADTQNQKNGGAGGSGENSKSLFSSQDKEAWKTTIAYKTNFM